MLNNAHLSQAGGCFVYISKVETIIGITKYYTIYLSQFAFLNY